MNPSDLPLSNAVRQAKPIGQEPRPVHDRRKFAVKQPAHISTRVPYPVTRRRKTG